MTPEQIVNQIMVGLMAKEHSLHTLAERTGMSTATLWRIIHGRNKCGGSLKTTCLLARYLGYELQLVKKPPSPASRGVSPCGNDSNHVSN